jgi:hypothetical protein
VLRSASSRRPRLLLPYRLTLPRDVNVHLSKGTRVLVPITRSNTVVLVTVLDVKAVRLGTPRARPVNGADSVVSVINVTENQSISRYR